MATIPLDEDGWRRLVRNIAYDATAAGVHRAHFWRAYQVPDATLSALVAGGYLTGPTAADLRRPEGLATEAGYCYHATPETRAWVNADPLSQMCRDLDRAGRFHCIKLERVAADYGRDLVQTAYGAGLLEVCYGGDHRETTLTEDTFRHRGDYVVRNTYRVYGGVLPDGTPLPAADPGCQGRHPMDGVPEWHSHWFFLRRDIETGHPKEAVAWAVWTGAFTEIMTWPWSREGLAEAQEWVDLNGAVWYHNRMPVRPRDLRPHVPGELAVGARR